MGEGIGIIAESVDEPYELLLFLDHRTVLKTLSYVGGSVKVLYCPL